ncbi:MAG: MFS transporter [Solirubrobacterales bacterium]|nr:MFS transporter [Solirubrobacterales bacterium]
MLLLGLVLIAANMRASITVVGPLLAEISHTYGLSGAAAGVLTALPVLGFAAFSPYAPRLARRAGMERALLVAMLVLILGIAVRSLPWAPALFAGTVVLAAGIAVANVLLPAVVKRNFSTRQSTITGIYATTMGLVAAIASGVAVPLASVAPAGWRTALAVWAMLVAVGVVVWLPRVRDVRDNRPARDTAPTPLRSQVAWLVTAFMGLQSFGFYVMIGWLPTFLRTHGVGARAAGVELFAYQLVSLVTSLALPLVADRIRDHRALAGATAVCCGIGYAGLLLAPGVSTLWVLVAGLGTGPSLVLALSFMALRAGGPSEAAALSAMAQSGGYLLAAAGPFLFGALHAATGTWTASLLTLLASAVALFAAGLRAGAPEASV